jgi:hypothetical protein
MIARLVCPARSVTFDLISNGKIISSGHSRHDFAAKGKKADGTRFNIAADLGLTVISFGEFEVPDLDAFLAWDCAFKSKERKSIEPTPAYISLQNEGCVDPEFIDRTPAHPLDY